MKTKFQEIAKVIKSHKLNGAVKIKLFNYTFKGQTNPAFLYINTENPPLPYFVKSFHATNDNECIVEFEDWNSKEMATKALKGKSIFIDRDHKTHSGFERVDESPELKIIGYSLFDQSKQFIGKIEDVFDIPDNQLVSISINQQEVLIPVHKKLIIHMDANLREIQVEIPNGLLNLAAHYSEEE